MVTALGLARRGVGVTLVDPTPGFAKGSRASLLWPRALEALDRCGAGDAVIAMGVLRPVVEPVDVRSGRTLISADFGLLSSETARPAILSVSQDRIEQALLELVAAHSRITVVAGCVTGLAETSGGVDVEVGAERGGSAHTARYVVAADGARSLVRDLLDIELVGHQRRTWLATADVRCANTKLAPVRYDPRENGLSAAFRIGRDLWRVIASVPGDIAGSVAEAEEHVRARARVLFAGAPHQVTWQSVTPLSNHTAERMRAGRILLAGDAGHVLSPSGGQGLNLGFVDAEWAVWAVAAALAAENSGHPRNAEAALDAYGTERVRSARLASRRAERTAIGEFYAPGWLRKAALPVVKLALRAAPVHRAALRRASMLGDAFPPPPVRKLLPD